METKESNLWFFFLFFSLSLQISTGTIDIKHKYGHKINGGAAKLFVFGDSYVDTGNWEKGTGPWLKPFGISLPGKPYGRFSDGRVLTDYIAAFLGIRSPVSFQWRKIADKSRLQNGMNFAHGGAGVFNTWKNQNLGFQINLLKHQLEENKYVYTKSELERSIALISIAGNDYGFFFKQQNGTLKNFHSFSGRVVEQLVKDMKQIHDLGVPRIALLAMEPNGCLPESTQQSSYKKCNQEYNSIAKFHNNLLRKAVRKLNEEHKKNQQVYVILDLYKAFISAIKKNQQNTTGNLKYYKNPLEPCVKVASNKRFEVCKYPQQSFFWDSVHPSQDGWHAIYLELRHSLHELLVN